MQIQLQNAYRDIREAANGMTSLTDLWKLAGSDGNKSPYKWSRQDETQGFLKATSRFLKRDLESLLKIKAGRGGGTWGVEQIALEYAQYLSPELAVLVNQAFLERIEEETNPELAIQRGKERAIRKWKSEGKTDVWIDARIQGLEQRKSFTSTLGRHGVRKNGFRNCTNAVYSRLFGGTTDVIRHKKSLEAKDNIRDNLTKVEVGAVRFAELLAEENIERHDLYGNAECELACTQASKHVASAIMGNRNADVRKLT